MLFQRHHFQIFALLVFLVFVSAIGFFVVTAEKKNESGVNDLRDDMHGSIKRLGGESAYEAFKSTFKGSGPEREHNAAHLFGESLFGVLGLQGISVCDSEFNFGCYHGFFSVSVKQEGLSIVPNLDTECKSSLRSSACQHGLGHGILEFLGHKNIHKALETCRLTDQPDPIAGCTSGVFMEYNVPLILNGTNYTVSPRPLGDPEEPYALCAEVAERFRGSCFHELAQWWNQVYKGNFERMGSLCGAVQDDLNRYQCFSGIGNIAGSAAAYDSEGAIALCKKMPTFGLNACLENAAWSFSANVQDKVGALAVCEEVSLERRPFCARSI